MTDETQSAPEYTPTPAEAAEEAAALRTAAHRSRRSFIGLGLAGAAGVFGWGWLISRPQEQGIPRPLRQVLEFNDNLTSAYYRNTRLAPEFARSRARKIRTNGDVGLGGEFDPMAWRLRVQGFAPAGTAPRAQEFTFAQLRALPRTEMTTEFKCVEGWSTIVTWAGVRLSDFLAKYPLATRSGRAFDPNHPPADAAPFVSLTTPDQEYYVGLEIESALHPQTLLCYEMNGEPLSLEHGAPLRLVTPLKYGIKQIKRIGTIAFVEKRPADYWAARGYDWHAGH
ncbi:Oxidoreductase molybdopterin binding domain-containing protein [Hymenobacter daecheongensis DSM 21074]|uniref:Oxidoreductase molybdopterin binding domain-containing protein n=1 Tax=Hymenobacter daecheongensis DSM 21074 TaxID=1121955 RepID=A0A1M6KT03_9BACT|nr:molybdopterin-dependent oxidoreductase [Hymenobacter daecheongensis]SHJ62063.1 Oxidoreductase molybdopterin binding domain-containing protein [Hymenobacter daecheongensis DSM 21074]